MPTGYYFVAGTAVQGPVPMAQLQGLIDGGKLTAATPLSTDQRQWDMAGTVAGLRFGGKAVPPRKDASRYDVFLSYRRDGGADLAYHLFDKLQARGYRVFLDHPEMPAGPFADSLLRVIEGCQDFVLVLSRGSLARCRQPDDWVRREIAFALQRRKNVVPLEVEDFDAAALGELPIELEPLREFHRPKWHREKAAGSLADLCKRLKSRPRGAWRRRALAAAVLAALALLAGALGSGLGAVRDDTRAIRDDTTQLRRTTDDIRQDTTDIKKDTAEIKKGVEGIGKLGGLIAAPATARDWYHNALVYVGDGNRAAAETAFRRYFALTDQDYYDPALRYARLLEASYPPERAGQMLAELTERHPASRAARLARLDLRAGDDSLPALTRFAQEHPDYLPVYKLIHDRLGDGTLRRELARSQAQVEFQRRGGFAAFARLILNPTDEDVVGLLEAMKRFGRDEPLDPMARLVFQTQIDQDITLLWVGVEEKQPGREITLTFPGGVTVTAPLNQPENPAVGSRRVARESSRGHVVALELPRYEKNRPLGLRPRRPDDVRIFPHYGYLDGIRAGVKYSVRVRYTDAEGHAFEFPRPVEWSFGGAGGGEAAGLFQATIRGPDGAALLQGQRGPRLHIAPGVPMKVVEVSVGYGQPYVRVPPHINVPTLYAMDVEDVPGFRYRAGEHRFWVKGVTAEGTAVGPAPVTAELPAGLGRKRPAGLENARQTPDDSQPIPLRFVNPRDQGRPAADYLFDALAFAPDGKRLAGLVQRGGLAVWELPSGKQVLTVPMEATRFLQFSADGQRVSNGQETCQLETGAVQPHPTKGRDFLSRAVSGDLAVAALGMRSGRVEVWDLGAGRRLADLAWAAERSSQRTLALSADGKRLAVGSPWEEVVSVHEADTGKVLHRFEDIDRGVVSLAFSPDGRHLLAGGAQGRAYLWDLAAGKDTAAAVPLETRFPRVQFTVDGSPLVLDANPGSVRVWNVRTGKELSYLREPVRGVKDVVVSPDGARVATANYKELKVWPIRPDRK